MAAMVLTAGFSIAVDSSGNAYVTGQTRSTNFPTANAIQATFGGGFPDGDAFVTKINAAGSALVYSTYLGGSVQRYRIRHRGGLRGQRHVVGILRRITSPSPTPFKAHSAELRTAS